MHQKNICTIFKYTQYIYTVKRKIYIYLFTYLFTVNKHKSVYTQTIYIMYTYIYTIYK